MRQLKADVDKIKIAMARACMNISDIHEKTRMPIPTIKNVVYGKTVRPATIGKIARALGVDVAEIIK